MRRLSAGDILVCGVLACVVACARGQAAAAPDGQAAPGTATQPAAKPSQEEIAAAIGRLGSDLYPVRQEATEFLWRAGRAAEPALRAALRSSDLEVVARAESVLAKFRWGIFPDTPPEVLELIGRYRTGNASAKAEVLSRLIDMGGPALQTAVAILDAERRAGNDRDLAGIVARASGKLLSGLLAEGSYDQAERLLELSSHVKGSSGARDYAAYLLVRGELDAAVERYAHQPPRTDPQKRLLVYLHRARGDLGAAAQAAEDLGDPMLLGDILYEKGDWRALANRQAKAPPGGSIGIEALGYTAAYRRLAGDGEGFAAACAAVEAWGRNPSEESNRWYAAEALLLNDRPGEAVKLLGDYRAGVSAASILAAQDRYDEALAQLSDGPEGKNAIWAGLERARVLWQVGKGGEAKRLLGNLASRVRAELARAPKDPNGTGYTPARGQLEAVLKAQGELGFTAEARGTFLAASAQAGEADCRRLLRGLYPPSQANEAEAWWTVLRRREPGEAPAGRLAKLDDLMAGRAPALLRKCAREALDRASGSPASAEADSNDADGAGSARDAAALAGDLAVLGKACARLGERDLGIRCLTRAAELSPKPSGASGRSPWVEVGDLWAGAKDWAKAAECYEKAWRRDRADVSALYLTGWALGQCGQKDRAKELTDRAYLLALGDGAKRLALIDTMSELGLEAEARREKLRLVRTAAADSHELGRCIRAWPGDVAGVQDEATLLERGRLVCLRTSTAFVETRYYLNASVGVHAARARGAIARSRWDEALAEADACFAMMPSQIDAAIDLVGLLDQRGRKADAQRVFARYFEHCGKLCVRWPDSGSFHNRAAWLAARCGRELDAALRHAQHAVALAPEAHAYLDTLAEVHFARGDRKEAIDLMAKCLKMASGHEWYRQQWKRFGGLDGTTRPGG